jgi:quercetin dioxygenase-like cupin family protein
LTLFAELVASGQLAEAQQTSPASQPTAPRPPVFKHDLPNLTMDGWEVTVSYVDYPPGRVGTVHHHAGFVLAYVLEGAVIAKISGQGEEKTYTTGQMFYEQPGATHEVSKKCEPDAAREAPRDDLREERLDADDTGARRSGARRSVDGSFAVKLGPGKPVFGLEHQRLERRSFQPARDALAVRVPRELVWRSTRPTLRRSPPRK